MAQVPKISCAFRPSVRSPVLSHQSSNQIRARLPEAAGLVQRNIDGMTEGESSAVHSDCRESERTSVSHYAEPVEGHDAVVQPISSAVSDKGEGSHDEQGANKNSTGEGISFAEEAVDGANLTGRKKKLFELKLKMNEARKANQTAMVAEKKRVEAPEESRGISKQKWLEDRKKKIGRLLDANGLEMSKAYMLDTQEMAESKYKKWEKEPAAAGWDVFNQKTLYNAYKKRTKNIEVDIDEYNRMKAGDPEFYRDASSLQYGKAPKISEEKVDKMVKELKDREGKRNSFSRRRKYHEEKDIDSINDRNEHFNKKIERAFGKYTREIKNNLERGTALPD